MTRVLADVGPIANPRLRLAACVLLAASVLAASAPAIAEVPSTVLQARTTVVEARSPDGARIAAECAGTGPRLIIVHGGTSDRSRWAATMPHFAERFRVCAMNRRGFGDSSDGGPHSLRREAEDVIAVVESAPGPAFVLGHSYGGVVALEAALLSDRIAKLVLYEPPVIEHADPAIIARIEAAAASGDRDRAVAIFLGEVIKLKPVEIAARRAGQGWAKLAATIHLSPRQMRAINDYRLDAGRLRRYTRPVLLLQGGRTTIPAVLRSIVALQESLPNETLHVLEGVDHFAMESRPAELAKAVGDFLLDDAAGVR
jgi:pimeloyl-ACP methyl ester carboxylesterase